MTYGWYTGQFGTSIRLEGLEADNSNALDRAIVMHRAAYAEPEHLARWGRLGRSNGCFAMGDADFKLALLQLGGGRVLFADRLGLAADGSTVSRPVQQAGEIKPLGMTRVGSEARLSAIAQPPLTSNLDKTNHIG